MIGVSVGEMLITSQMQMPKIQDRQLGETKLKHQILCGPLRHLCELCV